MANRKEYSDYAQTEVLPPHLRPGRIEALDSAAAEAQRRYLEYLRTLEEVPVLVDVVSEPPRVVIKDFRLGQRADARRTARDDANTLREQHAGEVAQQYSEYVEMCARLLSGPGRAARRSEPAKKRAKRVKRSARSKS